MPQPKDSNNNTPVLALGSSIEAPLIRFYDLEHGQELNEGHSIDIEESGLDRLSPIFQAIPGLLVKGKESSEKIMKVVVNGPLNPAADGNGMRAFVRDSNNKFTEHARLYEVNGLSQLISANAVFNIASAVVAQKHLADINEKLVEINNGLEKIKAFQQNERKSKITGAVEYLQQISPVVIDGKASIHVRQQLEEIESNLAQVQHHLSQDVKDLSNQNSFPSKKINLFGKNIRQGILKRQEEMSDILQQWWLCFSSRILACRLLAYFPHERELAVVRYDHLKNIADNFFNEDVGTFVSSIRPVIDSISSIFETKSEKFANKISLLEWEEEFLNDFYDKIRLDITNNDVCRIEHGNPIEVYVKVKEGRIEQCYPQ